MYEARVVDPHSLASMELNEYEAGKRSWSTSINNNRGFNGVSTSKIQIRNFGNPNDSPPNDDPNIGEQVEEFEKLHAEEEKTNGCGMDFKCTLPPLRSLFKESRKLGEVMAPEYQDDDDDDDLRSYRRREKT
ncbi:hypothetical protein WN51_01717 [Melipona quadrifasciata]|uniref:Uncharacterized protein n=1 Tax=Melipona quadrifasciata TaxID=166423 RepID=A0A0M8ZX78_9HYME|nr:hypothetical protein WN51_01717 [Melipona quadrifasciata]